MGILNIASKEKMEELILLQQIRDLASHGEDSFVYEDDEALTKMFSSKEAMNNTVSGSRLFKYGVDHGLHAGKALALIDDIGIADWGSLATPEEILNNSTAFSEVFANTKAFKYMRASGLLEYIPIDYIESSGTQYIDTGISGINYTAELDIEFLNSGDRNLMGSGSGSGYYFGTTADGYYEVGTSNVSTVNGFVRKSITVVSNSSEISLTADGVTVTRAKTSTVDATLALFMINGYADKYVASSKLYGCKLYVDGTLVRDFVPAKDFNGVICLYDKVTKQFFYNAGTGDFLYDHTHDYGDTWLYNETHHWKACACGDKDGLDIHVDNDIDGACDICGYKLFTPVNYIESSGTQYFNTGYTASNNTRVVATVKANNVLAPNSANFVFGYRTSNKSEAFVAGLATTKAFHNFGTTYQFTDCSFATDKVTVDANKNVCTFTSENGQSAVSTLTESTFTCPSPLLLLANNQNGTISNTYSKGGWDGRLYSCQIYENDELVRDFIPVLDIEGTPCLYDKATKEFFYNQGSGEFLYSQCDCVDVDNDGICDICGEEIFTYDAISYIQSNGKQYIDTGIIPKSSDGTPRIVLDAEFVSVDDSAIAGVSNTSDRTRNFEVFIEMGDLYWAYGDGSSASLRDVAYKTRYNIDCTGKNLKVTDVESDTVVANGSATGSSVTATEPIYLFWENSNSTDPYDKASMKLYSCQIYTGNTLMRDFAPAKDKYGTVCLYDKVSETFFYNKGAGSFTAGPEV